MHIMHHDAAVLARDAVFTVIKSIGSLEPGPIGA